MDGLTRPPFEALPPEAPLAMPEQDFRTAPSGPTRPASPRAMGLRRAAVFIPAILLTAFTAREMHRVLGVNGVTTLEAAILVVFVTLFAWIALALFSSIAGFVVLLTRPKPPPLPDPATLPRTALLMPAYNEDPARTMAALATIRADLARLGAGDAFDIFILSDTTDPDSWIAEEAAWLALRARPGMDRVFYRRRRHNTHRKAGNIADWIRRWGGAYPQFMILDADSLMTGECILHLAGAMAREPTLGLVQSLPVIVGGQTLFARMQQFAGRVYGPMIAHGLAWWAGADGNYWGHNATIRTRAFAEAAGLPTLPGRKPFGGTILSHDFVEAALLRRAGWGVVMRPELAGSYEESPPSLIELAIRDRRWCQGNLQHIAVLPTRGLHPISRLHLLMGIGSYVTAPLWLLFLVMGILISLQARFILPEYFPQGRSLFPGLARGRSGPVHVRVHRHHGRAARPEAARLVRDAAPWQGAARLRRGGALARLRAGRDRGRRAAGAGGHAVSILRRDRDPRRPRRRLAAPGAGRWPRAAVPGRPTLLAPHRHGRAAGARLLARLRAAAALDVPGRARPRARDPARRTHRPAQRRASPPAARPAANP